ncbi:MAG: TPM domain-containing protein [Novosphingobium sp.]|nr:TPM domain-containing protein [Novosphingobium sp.]
MPQPRPASAIALLAALLALAVLLAGSSVFAQTFPRLTGRVTDAAGIIPDDVEARLTGKLEALEQQSRRQLVVATIPDLQGFEIADYGYRLGRHWGIGDKQRNDGALLIIAPRERKVRIEVGYGLEPVLTDGLSWQIINTHILPRFRAGDLPGGIEAGVDAIIAQLTLPADQAQRIAEEAAAQADAAPAIPSELLFFLMVFMFGFVIPFFRTVVKRQRYPSTAGRAFVWDMLDTMPRGSGRFGGFSGGGGSFGGGGSSGSW